jgi:hypothetical protein
MADKTHLNCNVRKFRKLNAILKLAADFGGNPPHEDSKRVDNQFDTAFLFFRNKLCFCIHFK